MRDDPNERVAPYDLFRTCAMASSARDPFWRAVVSVEVAATPSRARDIEVECLRCHAPMASTQAWLDGEARPGIESLAHDTPAGDLARDGASCTLCHQIARYGLGSPRTWSGRFLIGDDREVFGPHDGVVPMPMLRHTGFLPRRGAHITDPGLCATCHTLFTEAFDPDGAASGGRLAEQTPYLEWLVSAYGTSAEGSTTACADCHLPVHDESGAPIETPIARNPHGGDFGFAAPRRPYGRHVLTGGNALLPRLLLAERGATAPVDPVPAVEAAGRRTRENLGRRTAGVRILEMHRDGPDLVVEVVVVPRTGHKFPTGHPSRRAWLRLEVSDSRGRLLFSSGGFDDRGRLVDEAGRVLPSERAGGPIQPHRQRIDDAGEVAVYEAVMADRHGAATWLLMRGAAFVKDNRLLPAGFDPDHPGAGAVRPVGVAADDDFGGAGDTVVYRVPVGERTGRGLRVAAELFYQPLGTRYVAEVLRHDTPEVRAFGRLWDSVDVRPVLVAGDVRAEDPETR